MKMQRRRRRGRQAAPRLKVRAAKKQGVPSTDQSGSGSDHASHSWSKVDRGAGPAWPHPACPGKPPRSTSSVVASRSCPGILALSNSLDSKLVSLLTCAQAPGRALPSSAPLSSSSSTASACRRACTCMASQRAPGSPSSSV